MLSELSGLRTGLAPRRSSVGSVLALPVADAVAMLGCFGLGGLLEDRLLSDIERSYAKAAVFTNRWIAERLAGGARPAP